jgi:hypothetical protein
MSTKPLNVLSESKIEKIRELSREEVQALEAAPYFIIAMANMSRQGVVIYQVSVNAGQNWAPCNVPPNCQYNTVPECNTNNQYAPLATVNCGSSIDLVIRWRKPDGTLWQGSYPGRIYADCNNYAGTLVGFAD